VSSEHNEQEIKDILSVKGLSDDFDLEIKSIEILLFRINDLDRGRGNTRFLKEKLDRAIFRLMFQYGHKKMPCDACNGSGHYDDNGSPNCGSCEGTGKVRTPGPISYPLLKRLKNPLILNKKNESGSGYGPKE
jgi:RecJ-like exonuclease